MLPLPSGEPCSTRLATSEVTLRPWKLTAAKYWATSLLPIDGRTSELAVAVAMGMPSLNHW